MAAGAAAAATAAAQTPGIYSLTVPMEVEYDSNPEMATANPRSTTWLRARPTLSATRVQGTEEYTLEAALSAEKSSNSEVAKDRLDPRLRAAWKHADPLNTTQLDFVADRRAIRSTELRENLPVGVDGSRTLFALGGSWTRELSERNSAAAAVRQTWERYSIPSLADYRLTAASLRFNHEMDERRTLYAVVDGQWYRPDERQDPVLGTVQGTPSESAGALAGLRHRFSDALYVDVAAGVVHFSRPRSDNEWQGAFRAEYTGERWSAALDLARSPAVSSTIAGLDIISDARVRARYAVDPLSRIEFNVGHSRARRSDSRRWIATVGWVRQLTPSWELGVRVGRRQVDDPGGRASSNLVALSLIYSAPDF
ncbi:MAG TPA: hypothetical protein VGD76_18825 [Ramlibacter sp.]